METKMTKAYLGKKVAVASVFSPALLSSGVRMEFQLEHRQISEFSGAFAKLRKATISFMSVRPSVRPPVLLSAWNNSAPTGRIFMIFDIRLFFEESVEKIQVSLKSDKLNLNVAPQIRENFVSKMEGSV
jgi:hypothetical protein